MLTEVAQRRTLTGSYSPSVRLVIGGVDVSEDISEEGLKLSYSVSDGNSELSLSVHRNLSELVNSTAVLWLGYGEEMVEYWAGKLYDSSTAWGPYKRMSSQHLRDRADYRTWEVTHAMYDLCWRSGFRHGEIEIRKGKNQILDGDTAIFVKQVALEEALSQLASNAGYTRTDMPAGRRLIMPTPRPGATGEAVARYDEDSIPVDDDGNLLFTAEAGEFTRNLYSAVRVFRDAEDGSSEIDVFQPVDVSTRQKPLPGSFFEVPEFTGDIDAAREVAAQYARLLSRGTYACSLGPVPFNNISPLDSLECEVEERELPLAGGQVSDRFLRTYSYIADDSIEVEVSKEAGNSLEVSGEGIRIDERVLPKPYYVQPTRTVRSSSRSLPGLKPNAGLKPSSELHPRRTRSVQSLYG